MNRGLGELGGVLVVVLEEEEESDLMVVIEKRTCFSVAEQEAVW